MRRRIRLLLLVLPVFLCAAQAQTPLTLSGVVIESGTGNPIPGATVSVVGGKANQDITDSQGKFSLTLAADVKAGAKIRIRVVKDGYGIWDNYIAASAEIAEPIWLKKLVKTSPHKPDEREAPDKSSEKPSEKSSPTVVQAPYGNLAKRCRDLGTAIIRFAEGRKQIQPDAKSHQQDYLDWFTRNDGGFRALYFDKAKALQKDLAAANFKDTHLDELIAQHEQFFAERNRLPPETVFSNAPMYHLPIEDIEEIGQRFELLASQFPPDSMPQNMPAPDAYISDPKQIQVEVKSVITEFAEKYASYKNSEYWWATGHADSTTMIAKEWKAFEDDYNHNLREKIFKTHRLLMSRINNFPRTGVSFADAYNSSFLMPLLVEQQLKDLWMLLNEFEVENGLPLTQHPPLR
jgi:hypothetical protein